ncbi:hypothetical protein JMJ35_001985 [Cladonia borealis]|uniref:Uncharacterized protein n=1 Tax=Cladonia borealis TaxID=184061 RepID=A0AA39UDX8_9LECA|nr:hypothetical protein JMJ35_001985 [Cladonia borealis]
MGSDEYLTQPFGPMLGPVASPSSQAPVSSVSTSKVANSEQLSPLDIPQATPPSAAAITLTTSNKNAASPINLPGNTASDPTAEPDQRTASNLAVNSNNVTPVGSSEGSAVPLQSTTHPPGSSNGISDPTNLVLAPGKTQPAPNSRGSTSPALPAASEDGKSVGMPRTLKTSLSPTSEYASAVSGTNQTSMPPSMIPTTAPAIPTVIDSAHNTYPASQRIGNGRILNSSVSVRVSGGLSRVGFMGNGTSGQKLSTASNITANVTAPSRPPVIVFSTSLFPVGTTATPSATISSSSNAGGLQFRGAGSRFRGLELIRLLGCLTVCMMVGARIFV